MPILLEQTCCGNILVRFEVHSPIRMVATVYCVEHWGCRALRDMLQDDSARMLDCRTGRPVMSVPPQLAYHSVNSCAWSAASQTVYMLLSNSTIHLWQTVQQTDRTRLVAVWTEHRRSRLVTLCIAPQATIPQAQLQIWGFPPANTEDDFLFAGTADGDVWIIDRHVLTPFCWN